MDPRFVFLLTLILLAVSTAAKALFWVHALGVLPEVASRTHRKMEMVAKCAIIAAPPSTANRNGR